MFIVKKNDKKSQNVSFRIQILFPLALIKIGKMI